LQRRFAKERYKLSESDPVCMSADFPERQGVECWGGSVTCESGTCFLALWATQSNSGWVCTWYFLKREVHFYKYDLSRDGILERHF
jgi:hypothetical protein